MVQQPNGKKRRARYRFSLVVFASVLTFVICFAVHMKNTSLEEVLDTSLPSGSQDTSQDSLDSSGESSDADASSSDDETSDIDASSAGDNSSGTISASVNPVPESASVGMDYFNNCAFVGDSITEGLASYQIFERKNVYASVGMNISKIDTDIIDTAYGSMTVIEGLVNRKPENVYIMLGSNGIFWMSNESMISKYSAFIDDIKTKLPSTKIYILSIPPVTAEKEVAAESPILNSDIDAYNSELLKLANEKSVYFVDLNTALKNNSGKFDSDMAARDGYHFQRSTYDLMLEYIMTHVAS